MTRCQELGFLIGPADSKRMWKMIPGVGDHPQTEQDDIHECVRETVWSDCCLMIIITADELGLNSERM